MKKILKNLILSLLILLLGFSSATAIANDLIKKTEQDDTKSQNNLGPKIYNRSFFLKKSLEDLQREAIKGSAFSQYDLGNRYFDGDDVPKDLQKAKKWFCRAAEQGLAKAQFSLGLMYYNGDGVPKNPQKAKKWFRKAAEQGHVGAVLAFEIMCEKNKRVPKDFPKALKWYHKAAKQGLAEAQYNLGNMYYYSIGIPKNFREASQWYRKAAEQGHVLAQYWLGHMYEEGEGVHPDNYEALKWCHKAAEQGLAEAQYNLGNMYRFNIVTPKNLQEASQWYRKAAEQGHVLAQYWLGYMYYEGKGVPQNYIYAYVWYSLATAQEGNLAMADRDFVAANYLNSEQLNIAQGLAAELQYQIDHPTEKSQSYSPETNTNHKPKVNGFGTGFIITKEGHILTCHHVIANAETIKVYIGKKIYTAIIIGDDKYNDLALLKISGSYPALAFSNRSAKMGQEVFTIGYPNPEIQGLNAKLTKGHVNSISGFQDDPRLYQISTPVQPGNSGGPLLDNHGNVIGIIVAMLDAKSVFQVSGSLPQNVNYAVKSIYAHALLDILPNVADILPYPSKIKDFDKTVSNVKKSIVMVVTYE